MARLAREQGTDPHETVRFLRQQIEANKQVQRAMHQRWNADPSEAPTSRPDLTQVREEINRINVEMVRAFGASASVRTAPSCVPPLLPPRRVYATAVTSTASTRGR